MMPRKTHSERIAMNSERIAKNEARLDNVVATFGKNEQGCIRRENICAKTFDKIHEKLEIVNREQGQTFESIDALKAEVAGFKNVVEDLKPEIAQNRAELARLDKTVNKLENVLDRVQTALGSLGDTIEAKVKPPMSSKDRAAIYISIITSVASIVTAMIAVSGG